MRALVTGAGGFLGTRVVRALLHRGVHVRALVRPGAKVDRSGCWADAEIAHADLASLSDFGRTLEGVDVVVHLAAALYGAPEDHRRSTIDGTENLLAAVARSRCRRIVLASSMAVYDWSAIETLTEDSPVASEEALARLGPYAPAKLLQERRTRQFAAAHDVELVVLRPGWIWGEGRPLADGLLLDAWPVRLAVGAFARGAFTHVENAADLFACCALEPAACGRTFNVVDEDGGELRALAIANEFLAHPGDGLSLPVPYALARTLVRAVPRQLVARPGTPGVLRSEILETRFKPVRFARIAARSVLGWVPPLDRAARRVAHARPASATAPCRMCRLSRGPTQGSAPPIRRISRAC